MRDKRSNTTQWDLVPHQQDGFMRLWNAALNAYINLLCMPFSFFYPMDTNGTEAATQPANHLAGQATLPVAAAAGRETATPTEEEGRLHLHEEQLQVHKQPVQTGRVRLGKEVVTEQKTINVPVTREEMVIKHRPASGQVSETPIGEGETIRIPISEEQVTVFKQTVETGEVALGKRQVQETQQVADTVRHEEARIESEGKVHIQGSELDESSQQPER